jgi:hypothetical protein
LVAPNAFNEPEIFPGSVNSHPIIYFNNGTPPQDNTYLQASIASDPLGSNAGNVVGTQFVVYSQAENVVNNRLLYSLHDPNAGTYRFQTTAASGTFTQTGYSAQLSQPVPQPLTDARIATFLNFTATTSASASTLEVQRDGVTSGTNSGSWVASGTGGGTFTLTGDHTGNNRASTLLFEQITYPYVLSANEMRRVQSYLAIKYGISLGGNSNPMDYVTTGGTVFWTGNATYNYDIFGIGIDYPTGIAQISGQSANLSSNSESPASGLGLMKISEASSLDNGDFLMIGHNNAPLSPQQFTNLPPTAHNARFSRQWKVQRTNDVGTVKLEFYLHDIVFPVSLGSSTNDYYILIDADGDGDFTNATAIQPSAVEFSPYAKLTFNGLDLPDGALFTFSMDLTGTTMTWDGSESTAWENGQNWSTNTVPGGADNAIIPDVTNDPVIASGIAADCKDLTVQSGATLTIASGGSLINTGTITNSGTINMVRDLSIGAWHLISIPTTGITANTFLNDYLQVWNETTHAWEEIIDPATVLNANQGYSLWSTNPGPASYTFTGTPLTGNQSQAVTFTEYSSDPNAFEGANLLGNPYPSSIDWSLLDDTWGAIYYWDQSANGGLGDYVEWNNGVGSGSQYVPPMQGFFIVTTANGTFSLSNSNRTHSGATAFYKSGISNGLVLEAKSGNNTDELFLVFNEEATNEFDLSHDALKFTSGLDGISQLYSFGGDRKLAIDVRPETQSIQLGFENNQSGIYSIGIKESDVENAWLEDIQAGLEHDLRNGSYQFAWDPATGNEKRFVLHFTALGIEDPVALESDVNIYAVSRDIHILSEQTGKVMVTDLAGRVLADREFSGNTTVALPGNIHPGVYLVVVTTGANVTTEKVFVR